MSSARCRPRNRNWARDARVMLPGFPAVLAGSTEHRAGRRSRPRVRRGRGPARARRVAGAARRGGVRGARRYVLRPPGQSVPGRVASSYGDNDRRFALLGWAAARVATGADPGWQPQIVHAHDWHAGLAPAYLRAFERSSGAAARRQRRDDGAQPGLPGRLPGRALRRAGNCRDDFYAVDGVEFYGHVSFLKAGLYFAERITTVSPTYAREIQTPQHGAGLRRPAADALARHQRHPERRRLLDLESVDRHDDRHALHAARSLAGKAKCKAALQERLGLERNDDALLFGVVSRLTEQKGLDLLLSAMPDIVQRGGQLAVLGTGDPALENGMKNAAAAHPGAVAVELGFDETLSHSIIAGSDIVMVPSRFEPCGLTQLYALAYGSLPLVHRVGGLADTVVDSSLENLADDLATGFVFDAFERPGIVAAIRRAFALKARRTDWKAVVRRAMTQNFGWEAAALEYAEVYRGLIGGRSGGVMGDAPKRHARPKIRTARKAAASRSSSVARARPQDRCRTHPTIRSPRSRDTHSPCDRTPARQAYEYPARACRARCRIRRP